MKNLIYSLEKMLFKKSVISKIEVINSSYVYIELKGEGLKNQSINIGDFFQITFGPFTARSYTPIEWNSEKGCLSFLFFSHGEGVAANWMKGAQVGDECMVYGPRKSMDHKKVQSGMNFIGDETTVGFAASIARTGIQLKYYFEVTNLQETEEVLKRFGIEAEKSLPTEGALLISGNAHRVRELRSQRKGSIGIPFWTPGKDGK